MPKKAGTGRPSKNRYEQTWGSRAATAFIARATHASHPLVLITTELDFFNYAERRIE
jgi:hypothetical protein